MCAATNRIKLIKWNI